METRSPSVRIRFCDVKVSGSQLFLINLSLQMEICDFSVQGHTKYLSERDRRELGVVVHISSTKARAQPWTIFSDGDSHNARDNIDPLRECRNSLSSFGVGLNETVWWPFGNVWHQVSLFHEYLGILATPQICIYTNLGPP